MTKNAQATNADCRLLQFPDLTLSLIWHHVCKLPMHDRCALLATCKRALSTFGGLTDRMERLQLTLAATHINTDRRSLLARPQRGGPSGYALRVHSWFPGARIVRLELRFAAGCVGGPSLRSFAVGAGMWLMHITSLKLHAVVRATHNYF